MLILCPIGWGCGIHRLYLCRGITSHYHNECPWYDTKQSDGEDPVMLQLWGMRNTPSLLLLPGLLQPKIVAPDRVLSMGLIELKCVLMINWISWNRTVLNVNCVLMLSWIVWNGTVFDIETVLTLNRIVWNRTVLIFSCVCGQNYTYTKMNCLY